MVLTIHGHAQLPMISACIEAAVRKWVERLHLLSDDIVLYSRESIGRFGGAFPVLRYDAFFILGQHLSSLSTGSSWRSPIRQSTGMTASLPLVPGGGGGGGGDGDGCWVYVEERSKMINFHSVHTVDRTQME